MELSYIFVLIFQILQILEYPKDKKKLLTRNKKSFSYFHKCFQLPKIVSDKSRSYI